MVALTGPVVSLDRVGAFVIQCGPEHRPQDLWTVQGGLRRLTRAPNGGVSGLNANASGTVVYTATQSFGADVHVLSPAADSPADIGAGHVAAVAPDGRIAFVQTNQTQSPLRDDVYVRTAGHARATASFPLVWNVFWRHGKLAAMIGPGRTHLVWDVEHPRKRLALPARGGLTIQVYPDQDRVAAQIPVGSGRYDLGVASRLQPRFRRVADNLYPVAWSPSGRFLLASDFPPSTRLSIVDVRRRVTAHVGSLTCGRVVQAAWLPRGTRLPPIPEK
jgi:hypothetical protein